MDGSYTTARAHFHGHGAAEVPTVNRSPPGSHLNQMIDSVLLSILEARWLGLVVRRCKGMNHSNMLQAVLRVLACYFTDQSPGECPNYPIPLHGVLKLTPHVWIVMASPALRLVRFSGVWNAL